VLLCAGLFSKFSRRFNDPFFRFFKEAELATGSFDVTSFFNAEGGVDSLVGDHIAKSVAVIDLRAFPLKSFHRVVGDEVDFGIDSFRAFGEDGSLFQVVVDAFDEDVFQRDFLFFVLTPKVQGIEEVFDGPFAIHGHDEVANVIGGSVERDSEADGHGELGEFADAGGEA